MKQKVVTKAIIKHDEKILLLRRRGGRPSIEGLYELPGGRIHFTQQPEDALDHALRIHLSVASETTQLDDVLTFVDPDDREVQYVFIIYNVSLRPTDHNILLGSDHDKFVWKELYNIQHEKLTESTKQILGMQQIQFTTGAEPTHFVRHDVKKTTKNHAIIYTDGGSRGNPGPSASGFVMLDDREVVVAEGGAFIGITTNNVAEYQAVYLALEKALELEYQNVDIRLDSQLVANQMNGIYRIKHNELAPINARIRELLLRFHRVTFTHVHREYNKLADGVVNKILDEHMRL
jgi:ribonuclease HI